jgi:hypothetical protein
MCGTLSLCIQICTFLYSVEEGFFKNNVSAIVLVKIKQIAQNNPLFSRIILAMSFAFKTESSSDSVVLCFE